MKNYNGALMNINQAILLNPQNDIYFYRRANVLFQLKIYAGAIKDYSKAIEINDSNEMYYFNRGLAKGCLRDFIGAIEDFEKVIEINPNKVNTKEIIKNLQNRLHRANTKQ